MAARVVVAALALVAAGPPSSNETVLTVRQSQRLVAYASEFGACLRRSGLPVSGPSVTRKLITLAVQRGRTQRQVVQLGLRCGARIGDPPLDSSLQTFADRVVLYVPKQCLIDPRVVRRAGGP